MYAKVKTLLHSFHMKINRIIPFSISMFDPREFQIYIHICATQHQPPFSCKLFAKLPPRKLSPLVFSFKIFLTGVFNEPFPTLSNLSLFGFSQDCNFEFSLRNVLSHFSFFKNYIFDDSVKFVQTPMVYTR
jgi:hypothetical protein